jgi:hypothetical protein
VLVIASLLMAGGLEASFTASSIVLVAGASPVISLLATIASGGTWDGQYGDADERT